MRIYRKVVIQILSGRIVAEDSYQYDGPISEAKGTVRFPERTATEVALQELSLGQAQEAAKRDEELQPFLLANAGLRRDESGTLVRLTEEEIQDTLRGPELTARQNLILEQERQTKALRGELPLTEAGQQQKAREFETFKELMARAGNPITGDTPETATATTTAGFQGLRAFNERFGLLEEAERFGQLTRGTQAILGRIGLTSDIGAQQRAGLLQFPSRPGQLAQLAANIQQPFQFSRAGQFAASRETAANRAGLLGGLLELGGTVGGIGLVGAFGGFKSARKYKKDIAPATKEEEKEALEMVKGLDMKTYHYRWEKENVPKRIGIMADEAPKSLVTEDREGLDIGRMVGMLTAATRALARHKEKKS